MKEEVSTIIIPEEGIHIFEFKGKGTFATHSNTLWSAWMEYTKNGISGGSLPDLSSLNSK